MNLDLVDTLRSKISALEDGDHMSGLRATLGHIEVAFRHLERGMRERDQTAFTDSIYRTNQAFEGSIKEAYRVLAGRDPRKKTPFQIEEYLEANGIFRERVLGQFKNYRTEWRNPSTHDYTLDFDESEAFLAIVSVSAFACLLSDQIAEKMAFDASKKVSEADKPINAEKLKGETLYDRASELIINFITSESPQMPIGPMTEAMLIGTIRGVFASAYPEIEVRMEVLLSPGSKYRADLLLIEGNERLIVELKRFPTSGSIAAARDQVLRYLEVSGIMNALLVYVPKAPEEVELFQATEDQPNMNLGIILPKSAIKSGA